MKLAGVPFRARIAYAETAAFCADYRTDEPPAFTVEIDRAVIEAERELLRRTALRSGQQPERRSDAELEFNALYRLSAERLARFGAVTVHGSAVGLDGEAYLFTAPSGTGKSTHTRLWREVFGERAVMINDDKPILRCTDAGVFACGSPWNGKHRLGSAVALPRKAICFLHRGTENRIEPTGGSSAYLALLRAALRPQSAEADRLAVQTLGALFSCLPFYRLFCNTDPEAAIIALRGMSNGNEIRTQYEGDDQPPSHSEKAPCPSASSAVCDRRGFSAL